MDFTLSPQQTAYQQQVRAFVAQEIMPSANLWDAEEKFPTSIIQKMGEAGFLGATLPAFSAHKPLDQLSIAILHEEFGRSCVSARNLLTVHGMAGTVLSRWGSDALQAKWGEKLAAGELIGGFALSEPNAGSHANGIETRAENAGTHYRLNGVKKWISFGQNADLFLLFAKLDEKPVAFFVERDSPGLTIQPIHGLSGCRASMLAELQLVDCEVPAENLVGRPGFGLTIIAQTGLDYGRFSVATGCVGLADFCLSATINYVDRRKAFGTVLRQKPLVQQIITEMIAGIESARLLCYKAAILRQDNHPQAIITTSLAKYHASKVANQIAGQAVHLHGAVGQQMGQAVNRHWRDAKVMALIEGSNQLHQMGIGKAWKVA